MPVIVSPSSSPRVVVVSKVSTAGVSSSSTTTSVVDRAATVAAVQAETRSVAVVGKGAQGPEGVEGPEGPAGPEGPVGPEGPAGPPPADLIVALNGTFIAGGYAPDLVGAGVILSPDLSEATFPGTQTLALLTPHHQGGIRYLEVTFAAGTASADAAIGVVGLDADLYHQIGYDGAANEVGMFQNTGRIYSKGTLMMTNGAFFDPGDIVGMAVNGATRQVWFRTNGSNWNGSAGASPLLGIGGITIEGSGPIYAAACTDEVGTFSVNLGASLSGALSWGLTAPEGVITLADVELTSPQVGDVLTFDGSRWTNMPASPGMMFMRSVELPLLLVGDALADAEVHRRDETLRASDWTQVPDAPLTDEERAVWATYRQALRDLPQQPGWPAIDWPFPPALGDGPNQSAL